MDRDMMQKQAYQGGAALAGSFHGNAPTPPAYSLGAGLENNLHRVGELASQLEQLADKLHGPMPQPVGSDKAYGGDSFAAITRVTTEQIDRCFGAMARIGGAL